MRYRTAARLPEALSDIGYGMWGMGGRAATPADEVFPDDHVIAYTHATLRNLGVERVDFQQLHVMTPGRMRKGDGPLPS